MASSPGEITDEKTPPLAGRGGNGEARPSSPEKSRNKQAPLRHSQAGSQVALGLGWLSVALGATAVLIPRRLASGIGMEGREGLLRAAGMRELTAAWGLLVQGNARPWLWSRVIGDVMDIAMLGVAAGNPSRRTRALTALGVVAGVTAIDLGAALGVTRNSSPGFGTRATPSPADGVIVETVIVNKSSSECYDFWRNLGQLPRIMPLLRSVRELDERRSHWTLDTPGGGTVEWDAEITHDEPGRRLAWRSSPNSQIAHAGVVRFTDAPADRGTLVHVTAGFRLLPHFAGPRFLGRSLQGPPRARLREDLRRFKQILETGEVSTTEGQSHGRRSLLGKTLHRWSLT